MAFELREEALLLTAKYPTYSIGSPVTQNCHTILYCNVGALLSAEVVCFSLSWQIQL
jgi:hypothetical protein